MAAPKSLGGVVTLAVPKEEELKKKFPLIHKRRGKKVPDFAGARRWRRVTVGLTDEQFEALAEETARRAAERGRVMPDMGEVIREAVALWMEGR